MLIAAAAVLLTAVFCTVAYYNVFREEVFSDLKVYTKLLADTEFQNGQSLSEDSLLLRYAEELADEHIRITLIDKDGNVRFDTIVREDGLDNHLGRREIREAVEDGEGRSVRRSSTIGRSNFYYALALPDGSILRTARESRNIISLFYHALPIVFAIAAALLCLCWGFSRFLTKRLLAPIESMTLDSEDPDSIRTYEELEPILSHIRKQHQDIIEGANMRQEFTANVSHELKTPLTSISGYAELIENGMAEGEQARRFAGEIRQNADRLLTLINDILRLSELDGTYDKKTDETVDLYKIAETCAGILEPSADRHGVTVEVTGEHAFVKANRDMAEELTYNLCDNAIRYNHEGGHVRIDVRGSSITVSDDGIGIAPEHQARIFERFFRVDKSRSKKTGGTGLGLAIVKHIVEIHGAELSLTSEEGVGTRITVRFPENAA